MTPLQVTPLDPHPPALRICMTGLPGSPVCLMLLFAREVRPMRMNLHSFHSQ